MPITVTYICKHLLTAKVIECVVDQLDLLQRKERSGWVKFGSHFLINIACLIPGFVKHCHRLFSCAIANKLTAILKKTLLIRMGFVLVNKKFNDLI